MHLLDHPTALYVATCVVLSPTHETGYRLRAFAEHRDEKNWQKTRAKRAINRQYYWACS